MPFCLVPLMPKSENVVCLAHLLSIRIAVFKRSDHDISIGFKVALTVQGLSSTIFRLLISPSGFCLRGLSAESAMLWGVCLYSRGF